MLASVTNDGSAVMRTHASPSRALVCVEVGVYLHPGG
jgi:hypothetical protein